MVFETIMLFVGLFTKFKMFDHAAHLGGLLFGMYVS